MDSFCTRADVFGLKGVFRGVSRDSTRSSRPGSAATRGPVAGPSARVVAMLLVLVCAVSRAEEDAGALKKKIDAELKAMDTDLAAIRSIRDTYRAAAPKGKPPITITLSFPNVVEWRNNIGDKKTAALTVRLRHFDGETLVEPATVVPWRTSLFPAQVSDLRIAPDSLSGVLGVQLDDDGMEWVKFPFKGTIENGKVGGTWSTEGGSRPYVAPRSDALAGAVAVETSGLKEIPYKESVEGSVAQSLYEHAQWYERCSQTVYNELRALVMARERKISLPHASRLISTDEMRYPPLKKESSKPEMSVDSLDVIDSGPAADTVVPALKVVLSYVPAIRMRVADRRRAAETQKAADERGGKSSVVVGDGDSGDPWFGPWFGEESLATTGGRTNALPEDAGTDGVQRWPLVADWTCFGPYRLRQRLIDTPFLPEFFPALECGNPFSNYREGATGVAGKSPGKPFVEAGFGRAFPPFTVPEELAKALPKEFPNSTMYALSSVFCPDEKELWVGVSVNDHGRLWINDRLVWTSPPARNARQVAATYVFPVRFAKGANKMLLRCDNDLDSTWFSVRICARGKPRPAEEAKRAVLAAEKRIRDAGLPYAGTVGWRNDGSGKYPGSQPPVAWDMERNINVIWRKPMGPCNATPMAVGDAVVTMDGAQTVVCLKKADGSELWRTEIDIALTKSEAIQAEAAKIRAAVMAAQGELDKLGANNKERREALIKQGVPAADAAAKVSELERQAGAYAYFLRDRCGYRGTRWGADVGPTYGTPVTDGKRIWAKSNTGSLACLNLDGKIVWLVDHGCTDTDVGGISSLLLVGNRVFVYGPDNNRKPEKAMTDEEIAALPEDPYNRQTGVNQVRAFDAETGKCVWSSPFWSYGCYWTQGKVCGTPVAVRVSNGTEVMDVLVTANGTLIRADDGKVFLSYLGRHEKYGSPISDGANRVIINGYGERAAYEIVMLDRDTVGAKLLWYNRTLGEFQDGNYGLYLDGKLYYARPLIDVTDLASGAQEWESGNIFFCRPGRGYAPVALAGGNLYVADNAQWFQPTYRPGLVPAAGCMAVVAPGTPCTVLARNHIEQVHGGFAFETDRIYVRSMKSLTCYGYTGIAGRAWEAEKVFTELARNCLLDRPSAGEPVAIATTVSTGGKRPLVGGASLDTPRSWLLAGPLAGDSEEEANKVLSDPQWQGWFAEKMPELPGMTLKVLTEGNMPDWCADDHFKIKERKRSDGTPMGHGPHIRWGEMFGDFVAVSQVIPPKPGCVAVLATLLTTEGAPRLARFDSGNERVFKAWIGGVPVKHNQTVQLPAGTVSMVVALHVEDPADRCLTRPMLWASEGAVKDLAAWRAHVERIRQHIESAARLAPDTAAGKKAKVILADLSR